MPRTLVFALTLAAVSLGAVALVSGPAFAATWEIDSAHSAAHFEVRHLMVSTVRGELSRVTGTIEWDPKTPNASTVEATIDAGTINTREEKRDADLKGPNFFDVAKFPSVTFKSKKVARAGHALKVTGDLTIHGVTREVVLEVSGPVTPRKDPWGNLKSGATATTKINRKDFGLTWNKALEGGGVVVSDEV
jgi:polyisoprenoid-binding protein YceI